MSPSISELADKLLARTDKAFVEPTPISDEDQKWIDYFGRHDLGGYKGPVKELVQLLTGREIPTDGKWNTNVTAFIVKCDDKRIDLIRNFDTDGDFNVWRSCYYRPDRHKITKPTRDEVVAWLNGKTIYLDEIAKLLDD